jgi:ferrous iron transport protein A
VKLKITFMNLDRLPIAASARVVALKLDAAEARRVRAIGVFEDEAIVVLRRAPFGGPLHVRTSSGGEFALDVRIARAIEVEVGDMQEAAE